MILNGGVGSAGGAEVLIGLSLVERPAGKHDGRAFTRTGYVALRVTSEASERMALARCEYIASDALFMTSREARALAALLITAADAAGDSSA